MFVCKSEFYIEFNFTEYLRSSYINVCRPIGYFVNCSAHFYIGIKVRFFMNLIRWFIVFFEYEPLIHLPIWSDFLKFFRVGKIQTVWTQFSQTFFCVSYPLSNPLILTYTSVKYLFNNSYLLWWHSWLSFFKKFHLEIWQEFWTAVLNQLL